MTIDLIAMAAGILVMPVIIICLAKELKRIKTISQREKGMQQTFR